MGSAGIRWGALGLICALAAAGAARAQDDAYEKTSKKCNPIYVRLCHGIKPGPLMLGKCFEKRPSIEKRIPAMCRENFQTSIENYNDARPK
jgi:hypothetical protein